VRRSNNPVHRGTDYSRGVRPVHRLSGALSAETRAAPRERDLTTLIAGLLAVPTTWYLVFLGVGHLLERQRRATRATR